MRKILVSIADELFVVLVFEANKAKCFGFAFYNMSEVVGANEVWE